VARVLDFPFPLPNGLHAHPAAVICGVVARFRSTVTFVNRYRDRSADARSALALVATLTRHGDPCTLRIEGDDESAAAVALKRLLDAELLASDEPTLAAVAPRGGGPLPRALTAPGVVIYRGVPASSGVARSRAVVLGAATGPSGAGVGPVASIADESALLDGAFTQVGAGLRDRVLRAVNPTERAIFVAQLTLLEDVELRRRMLAEVAAGATPASRAVLATADHFATILEASDSAYLRERAFDVRDLAAQLVRALAGGVPAGEPSALEHPAACVAATLTPAQLIALGTGRVEALVLAEGGTAAHTVILARSLGIACVTGVAGIHRAIAAGQDVVVDGGRGLVIPDPPPGVARFYEGEAAKLEALRRRAGIVAAPPDEPLLVPEAVRLRSHAGNREEAIRELVDLLHLAGRVDDPDGVEAAIWAREETASTGVGFGVAIPHCVAAGVRTNSIAVLRLPEPIDWSSADDRPVELAIMIAIRADAPREEHLRALAGLSRRLIDEQFRSTLLAALDGAEVAALLDGAIAAAKGGGS
jgi:fructose-specific PTS system IIA-like component